jgi:hypothetical protein
MTLDVGVAMIVVMEVVAVMIAVMIVVMVVAVVVVWCRLLFAWFTDPDLVRWISASACFTHNACFYSTRMDLT